VRGNVAIGADGKLFVQTSQNLLEVNPTSGATTRVKLGFGGATSSLGPVLTEGLVWVPLLNGDMAALNLSNLGVARTLAHPSTGNYRGVGSVTADRMLLMRTDALEQLDAARPTDLLQLTNGRFLLTSSQSENSALIAQGFVDTVTEGGVFLSLLAGTSELFRLVNPSSGDRLYSTSVAERDAAIGAGFQQEASPGFVFASGGPGRKPLKRFFNAATGTHIASGNPDLLADPGFAGFVEEGTLGFVRTQRPRPLISVDDHTSSRPGMLTTSVARAQAFAESVGLSGPTATRGSVFGAVNDSPGLVPLFQLRDPATGDRLYTTSASERAAALAAGRIDEGIAGYVHLTPAPGRHALVRGLASNGFHHYSLVGESSGVFASNFSGTIEGVIGFVQS
jgi:hypothetical protein